MMKYSIFQEHSHSRFVYFRFSGDLFPVVMIDGVQVNCPWTSEFFKYFHSFGLSYQIWPCHKLGQGQLRVIIWTNYDGLESQMLHTKFRGNRSTGSGEDFWRVFTIYGLGGHLGHVTSIMSSNFHFLIPESLHSNLVKNGPVVLKKNKF